MAPASSKKFLYIRETIECTFNLKLVSDMIITVFYNQLRYPFMINLDSCNVSCNTVDDLSRRICVPNKTTDVNLMHLIW